MLRVLPDCTVDALNDSQTVAVFVSPALNVRADVRLPKGA